MDLSPSKFSPNSNCPCFNLHTENAGAKLERHKDLTNLLPSCKTWEIVEAHLTCQGHLRLLEEFLPDLPIVTWVHIFSLSLTGVHNLCNLLPSPYNICLSDKMMENVARLYVNFSSGIVSHFGLQKPSNEVLLKHQFIKTQNLKSQVGGYIFRLKVLSQLQ